MKHNPFDMLGADGRGMYFPQSHPFEFEITNKKQEKQEIVFLYPGGQGEHKFETDAYSVVLANPNITLNQVQMQFAATTMVAGMIYIDCIHGKLPLNVFDESWDGQSKLERKTFPVRLNKHQQIPTVVEMYFDPMNEPVIDIHGKWSIELQPSSTIRVSVYPCEMTDGSRYSKEYRMFTQPSFSQRKKPVVAQVAPRPVVVAGHPPYATASMSDFPFDHAMHSGMQSQPFEVKMPPRKTVTYKFYITPQPKWWQLWGWVKYGCKLLRLRKEKESVNQLNDHPANNVNSQTENR